MNFNPVVWFEIYVNDMNRAKAFYEKTLGVTLNHMPMPSAEVASQGSMEMWSFPFPTEPNAEMTTPGASGMLVKMEGFQPGGGGGTLVYFGCDDCAVTAARAVAAGGKIFKEKLSLGNFGFMALAYDTEGNLIGFHSMQ